MRPPATRREYEDRLARELLPKVRQLATRHAGKLDADELESIGLVWLARSIRSYDPRRGAAPWTHCLPRVRGAMLQAISRSRGGDDIDLDHVSRYVVDPVADPQDSLPDGRGDAVQSLLAGMRPDDRVLVCAMAEGVADDGDAPPGIAHDVAAAHDRAWQVNAILDCRPPAGHRHAASCLHEALAILGHGPRTLRSLRSIACELKRGLRQRGERHALRAGCA